MHVVANMSSNATSRDPSLRVTEARGIEACDRPASDASPMPRSDNAHANATVT